MTLKWKCSFCKGTGGGPVGVTKLWDHEFYTDWHQERCKHCKGTGILPYRKENKLAFENGEYDSRLIREREINDR
ncbi:hypothetical protein LCGC14_2986950 [marine sediment metagenome]|uniref:Uncharacterized protein n=1 Tax=marine sediment metagenome TaxID=412755 RepID=A0A0F8X5U9_9ZZZZ|nr:hypothetical protein [bacterium]